jgi:hypothetical protein
MRQSKFIRIACLSIPLFSGTSGAKKIIFVSPVNPAGLSELGRTGEKPGNGKTEKKDPKLTIIKGRERYSYE